MTKHEKHYHMAVRALSSYREKILYDYEEIHVNDKRLKKELEGIDAAMAYFKPLIKGVSS